MDCLFCKIAAGKIPSEIVYQDDEVLAFNDINPKAPHHVLIIPRKHIPTVNDIDESDNALLGHMVQIGKQIAKDRGLAENGFRLVFNCNRDAGQEVFHLHLHLLGGRKLNWPPG